MLFEQPAELNKYDFTSLTWAARWQMSWLFFPAYFLCWAIVAESILFEAWLKDESLTAKVSGLLALAATLYLIVPVTIELEMKLGKRRKKSLQIDETGFKTSANRLFHFHWKGITAWHLEPIIGNDGLRKLKMEFSLRKKLTQIIRWSIILKQPDQTDSLKSELERIRQNGTSVPPLTELSTPQPKSKHLRIRGIWPMVTAIYLFLHALLFLLPGVMLTFPKTFFPTHSDAPPEMDKLTRLIVHHFSTVEKLRNFLLINGGCLLVLAAIFYLWAR